MIFFKFWTTFISTGRKLLMVFPRFRRHSISPKWPENRVFFRVQKNRLSHTSLSTRDAASKCLKNTRLITSQVSVNVFGYTYACIVLPNRYLNCRRRTRRAAVPRFAWFMASATIFVVVSRRVAGDVTHARARRKRINVIIIIIIINVINNNNYNNNIIIIAVIPGKTLQRTANNDLNIWRATSPLPTVRPIAYANTRNRIETNGVSAKPCRTALVIYFF